MCLCCGIFQCHKELGNHSEARNWAQLALNTPTHAKQVIITESPSSLSRTKHFCIQHMF